MTKRNSERRRHKRCDLSCPVTLSCDAIQNKVKGKTLNVSDGGVLVSLEMPCEAGQAVEVKISLPRTTPSTHMFEEFTSKARIIRHQPADGEKGSIVAMKFTDPLAFNIEV